MDKLKKLSKDQRQLVGEFVDLLQQMKDANVAIVGDPECNCVIFFNKSNAEIIYSSDDFDWEDGTEWYATESNPAFRIIPIEYDATMDFVDTSIGIKFKD